jgi:hypothetical protein
MNSAAPEQHAPFAAIVPRSAPAPALACAPHSPLCRWVRVGMHTAYSWFPHRYR